MYHSVDLQNPQWSIENSGTAYKCTPGETLNVSFTNKNTESNWGGMRALWAGWRTTMANMPKANPFSVNSTDTLVETFIDLKSIFKNKCNSGCF